MAGLLEDSKAAYDQEHYQAALSLFQPLASQGNAEAQLYVGQIYEAGITVPKDETEVIVPKNEAEAMKWYRRAADQGSAWAQRHIGDMYAQGLGVPPDLTEAERWYRKSDETLKGNSPARNLFAPSPIPYYLPPEGVISDQGTAVQVAEAILKPIYGGDKIRREEPFIASLANNIWTVQGSLPKNAVGGTALIKLSKTTGRVLQIGHFE
jgi:hypothetical protein